MAEVPAVRDPSGKRFTSIFGVDGQQRDPEARSKHRIQKVPVNFREYEKDKKYFDPRVVSLGPYHHGKDDLKPMEKHKITVAKGFVDEFISRNGGRGGIYEKFMDLTRVLKECYEAEVVANTSDDDFVGMMFLDGCFVLYFITKYPLPIFGGGETMLKISNDLIPLIFRDMFFIENQLPFEVLDALTSLRGGHSRELNEEIVFLFCWNANVLKGLRFPRTSALNVVGRDPRPLHLLDILRNCWLDFPPSNGAEKRSYRSSNFGSLMELKEIGIRIEKRDMESLMDISFEENLLFPRLLLPTIFINDITISQFLNLTALDTLINNDADVKMLRSKGILHHSLGSDDEVARLFNTWPADVTNDLKLYNNIRTTIATWLDKYFGSPWTAISFVAAVLLLVFTAIQTDLAAFPRR